MSQYYGTSPVETARKCFDENINQYVKADPIMHPEAFNLYSGLKHLVDEVQSLQDRMAQMEQRLAQLERRVR